MTDKLLPCPFCGSEPEVVGDINPRIQCKICDVRLESNRFIGAMWRIDLAHEKQLAEATVRWNRRPPAVELRERGTRPVENGAVDYGESGD